MFAPQFNSMLMKKYKTCDHCCYDTVDDSGNIMEHECSRLKVTGVRYFETRRGIGYQCKTNVPGVHIWNDGDGGGTYVDVATSDYTYRDFHNEYLPNIGHGTWRYESALEELINEFEGVSNEN